MDIERQLRDSLALRDPGAEFEDAVMARLAAPVRAPRRKRRGPNRGVLFGTILIVAAAAAMLVLRLMHPQPPVSAATTVPDPVAEPIQVADVAELPAAAGSGPQSVEEEAGPAEAAVKPFAVRVLPLQNDAKDAAGRDAIASLYAALLDRLRAVPGLTLLEPDQAGSTPEAQPDYRITIRGDGLGAGDQFRGTMQAETMKPDGTVRGNFVGTYTGDAAPHCRSTLPLSALSASTPSCADPPGVAAGLVGRLRTMVFPPDPSVRRQLQVQLLNRSLDARQRLQALADLAVLGSARFSVGAGSTAGLEALRDPAVVRGAIDLAATAVDPLQRAQIWATLRGVGNAELLRPLLAALRHDADGDVRLAALGTLAADFRGDERVQQALEAAARLDARPLVRALSQRALGGAGAETGWLDYITASLKDLHRSAVERIEALFYQLDLPTTARVGMGLRAAVPQGTLRLLDDEAIRALAEVLPVAAADSTTVQNSAARVAMDLGRIDHPAVTDMLLASLDDGSHWLDRGLALQALAGSPARRDDPRVRAALEKISADDPSPQLRQAAAASLRDDSSKAAATPDGAAVPATGAGIPPRLGVMLNPVESGPYVPEELVGKAAVVAVAADSVGQKAGLLEGDVLLEINGTSIPSIFATGRIVESVPRGVDVDVLVYRFGKTVTLKARF